MKTISHMDKYSTVVLNIYSIFTKDSFLNGFFSSIGEKLSHRINHIDNRPVNNRWHWIYIYIRKMYLLFCWLKLNANILDFIEKYTRKISFLPKTVVTKWSMKFHSKTQINIEIHLRKWVIFVYTYMLIYCTGSFNQSKIK